VEDLKQHIPDWSNQLYEGVLKFGVEAYGFKPEEVGNVTDPRMIRVLVDAQKYRALQKAKPGVEKRVAAAPKVLSPGAAQERSEQNQSYTDARKALAKDHTVDSAARVFYERERARKR
jgi:hypothetical protein